MARACVIVLDAVGAGALPDAAAFGDEGSDTLGSVARAVGGLDLPNLEALGLGNVEPLEGCPPQDGAPAVAGRLVERSKGKDTTTGHWELMGVLTPQPFPTYPHGFPDEVIDPFMNRTGRHAVGRVIARPFTGEPGNYERTPNRHDFSLEPSRPNYLSHVRDAGNTVYGVGKIGDIFAGVDIDDSRPTKSNVEGIGKTIELMHEVEQGLVFVNL